MNIAALIPSLIGLGTTIAGAVPGLKKPKRQRTSQVAAQRAQAGVQKAAIGAASTTPGQTGLNLRTGLRAASTAAMEAGGTMAQAADLDERRFEEAQQLRQERIQGLTSAIGSGASQMTQAMLKPDTDQQVAQKQILSQQPELSMSDTAKATGLGAPGAGMPQAQPLTSEALPPAEGAPDLDQLEAQMAQQEADEAAGPTAQFESTAALEELRAKSPTVAAPEIEADLENRLQAKKLMLQDAERLGINHSEVVAQINRRFNLQPGQSVDNPLGISLDYTGAE